MEIKARGISVWLTGLADLWTRPQRIDETIAKVPQGQPVIALTHNPDIFPGVPQRVPLLLAGHTHGGQVRFPIIGTVIATFKLRPTLRSRTCLRKQSSSLRHYRDWHQHYSGTLRCAS